MFFNKKEEFDDIESKIISDIRALNVDIINKHGNSNLEFTLNIIPALYTLYSRHIRVNKDDPNWINRDRVVLSTYTGVSALLSVLATCTNYISLDILKEDNIKYEELPGIDVLPSKFAEGVAIAGGMACGEKYLNNTYKKGDKSLFNFTTYLVCTDLDLINGTSFETFSYIGKNKLNKFIVLYDCNPYALSENNKLEINAVKYFEALNYNIVISNKENILDIDAAIIKAKESDKPTVIILNHEGKQYKFEENYYETNYKLTDKETAKIKKTLKVRNIPFTVSNETVEKFKLNIDARMNNEIAEWTKVYEELSIKDKEEIDKIKLNNLTLNSNIDFDIIDKESLVDTSDKIIESLKSQNNNIYKDNSKYSYRNNMISIQNGLSLIGLRNYSINNLSDMNNVLPAIETAIKMKLPNIYIFIEDENNANKILSLRNLPNFKVFRPNDANELIGIYKIISTLEMPCSIVLGKNMTSIKEETSIVDVKKGGYILKKEDKNISCILISNGNDLDIAMDVVNTLKGKGYDIRIVSMPSIEQFQEQNTNYQEEVIPFGTKVFVLENSTSYSWYKYVYNDKYLITSDMIDWNYTDDNGSFKEEIIEKIENLLK